MKLWELLSLVVGGFVIGGAALLFGIWVIVKIASG